MEAFVPTREEQEALRRAFVEGASWRFGQDGWASPEAAKRYPIQEPRVVRVNLGLGLRAQEYRVVDGALQWRYEGEDHWRTNGLLTKAQLEAVLGLFDSPMERKR